MPNPEIMNPANALNFCLNLARIEAALSRRFDHRLGSLHGLSFGDFTVLLYLRRSEGGRLRRVELAGKLGLTASGITRTLIPLEKIGLVTRQSDARDARVGYAALTDNGRELLQHALHSAEQIAVESLQDVSGEQLGLVSQVLGQITARLS